MKNYSYSITHFIYQFAAHINPLVIVAITFAGTSIIITTSLHTAYATYGSLGYEIINGRATGWEWGATQPQPSLEPDPANNPRLQAVTQDVREGNQALKATVHPSDNFNNGARAEVVHWNSQQGNYYLFTDGQQVEYRWYTKIPAVFPMKNTWHIITQWHQVPDLSQCWRNNQLVNCPGVPLTFNLRDYDNDGNPTLELLVINKENSNFFDRLWQRELTQQDRDTWHEFRLHIKWSACDNYDHSNGRCILEDDGAFLEFWFNNQKQQLTMPVTPFYNMDNDRTVYMKQGLYHCRLQSNCPYSSSDPPLSIYHDGMEFTVWSDVLSRIKITSLGRINGQDRVLNSAYQLTQSALTGNPDWKIYHYVWKENPQHLDVEAIVGVVPFQNGYVIEVGKLTNHAIRIDIDGIQTITIPATTTLGQPGSGFVAFTIPR